MKRILASSVVFGFLILTLVLFFQNCASNSSSTTSVAVAAVSPVPPTQIIYNTALGQQATRVSTAGSPPLPVDVVGISPVGITAGQFNLNGAGGIDLLISGEGGVYYAPNTGGGNFNVSSLTPIAVAGLGTAGALVTGQFGVATGLPGFAVVDSAQNNLIMVAGNGDGTFNGASPVTASVAPNSNFIFPFDLNGDTYLDAQVLSPTEATVTSVMSAFNPSTSTVTYSPSPTNLGSGAAMVVGDLNGDGLLDVVTYSNGNLNIFFANSGGSGFSLPVTAPVPFVGGSSVMQMAIGDLNGDGLPDIVAYTNSYSPAAGTYAIDAHYFQNGGSGNFTYVRNDTFNVGPNFVYTGAAIQDLNGDGNNDVALVGSFGIVGATGGYIMLKACSQTTLPFTLTCVDTLSSVQNGAAATAMTIADINADGLKDVIVTGSQDAAVGNSSIYVFTDAK